MNRREFTKDMLWTISGILLLQTVSINQLVAKPYDEHLNKWLKSLQTLCADLRKNALSVTEWQTKIAELHNSLSLEDLSVLIDFDKVYKQIQLPDLGVRTRDVHFPRIAELANDITPIGRIFGMQKDRAIIPHGHKNMVSCHRVIKGNLLLRQYDRLHDEGDYMHIRQTIEQVATPGSHSSISDEKNNVHWLIAKGGPAYTFDVIVPDYNKKDTEIDNLDMDSATKEANGILKVKKMKVDQALNKYGFDTHH